MHVSPNFFQKFLFVTKQRNVMWVKARTNAEKGQKRNVLIVKKKKKKGKKIDKWTEKKDKAW